MPAIKDNVKTLLNNNEPFAVVQYFTSLKTLKSEKHKSYEIICCNKRKDDVKYIELVDSDLEYFKNNISKFKLVIDNSDGRVYERNNFKNVYDQVMIVKKEKLEKTKKYGED